MRRSDREVKDFGDIIKILDDCSEIHLALSVNDKPYSVPLNFGYEVDGGKLSIFIHGAKEGKKHDIIAQNQEVSFSGVSFAQFFKAEEAIRWSTYYKSVIGFGKISIVNSSQEKIKGLDLLMKHCGFTDTPSYPPQSLDAVRVMKIEVEEITGKQHNKE
ncbi:MAG: pyridoxamine 5'-phosphate oxidase family protein [Elusimicrobiota bacterium]|jgi:nitroimidazol reductase NimA-like FMN-containing flavoprotein (pyridoxamine 5'-phosphate oxidase superfamily)|nr:pyridoxamine 5'-phosphate oxidase family protein [Elusimicrobiota bacterium]